MKLISTLETHGLISHSTKKIEENDFQMLGLLPG